MSKRLSKLSDIESELKCIVDDLQDRIDAFSNWRFRLLERAEAGDEKANELYEGWTREMHLDLGNAMEKKP